jgi:hypothetical protein
LHSVTTRSRANNATEDQTDNSIGGDTDDKPHVVDGSGDGFGRSKVMPSHLGNILPFDRNPKIAHNFHDEDTCYIFQRVIYK